MVTLIRPNGLVERLSPGREIGAEFSGYGRSQPGPTSPDSLRSATEQDRRRRRRPRSDLCAAG